MKESLISVIVPVYKVEKYLHRCINSLINQSYKNLEIILIDDGSPDSSPEICDSYAIEDSRIKVIHKSNGGVSSARNTGIAVSKGDYIAFVDADDYISPDMYETMLKDIRKTKADAVFCGYIMVDENGTILYACEPEKSKFNNSQQALKQVIGAINGDAYYGTGPWNKLISKRCVAEIQFNEDITVSEDALFLIDVMQNCSNVYFDPTPLYYYVQREGSAYHTKGVTKQKMDDLRAWRIIREKLFNDIELRKRAEYVLFDKGIDLLIKSYCENMNVEYEEIRSLTLLGRNTWMTDNKNHIKSKLKACLLLAIMDLRISKKIVRKVAEVH